MTIVTPEPTISRDRYGRPLVIPLGGSKLEPYTRCTTYVDCIEDKFNLQQWMSRMVAIGLATRPDLLLGVSAHKDNKAELNRICEAAKEAAASSAAATTGTALHALTETIDRGGDVGVIPETYQADLDAYSEATRDLKALHIERFTVLDTLKIGGTPDRIVSYNGKRYIADIKTGSIEYGTLKIAAQLAVYARSALYDTRTGARTIHGAEVDKGIIIHLPAGTGTCELIWVDLLEGWYAVDVARRVREKRTLKFKDLTTPFGATPVVPEPEPHPAGDPDEVFDLPALIRGCPTPEAVRNLWALHQDVWTDEHTAVATSHIATLGGQQKESA